ncbi:unnamed protein product [Colias eurytheme]|nr:unnamed protein product [Colias eurytheme]
MCARILLILGLILMSGTYGQETQANEVEKSDTITTTINTPIDRSSHYHYAPPSLHGFWKKRLVWRPRWVKTWQEKKVYVAVWKHMWSPAHVKEWVPVPQPPPGWVKHAPNYVKIHH